LGALLGEEHALGQQQAEAADPADRTGQIERERGLLGLQKRLSQAEADSLLEAGRFQAGTGVKLDSTL
jgi:hypothetical protein